MDTKKDLFNVHIRTKKLQNEALSDEQTDGCIDLVLVTKEEVEKYLDAIEKDQTEISFNGKWYKVDIPYTIEIFDLSGLTDNPKLESRGQILAHIEKILRGKYGNYVKVFKQLGVNVTSKLLPNIDDILSTYRDVIEKGKSEDKGGWGFKTPLEEFGEAQDEHYSKTSSQKENKSTNKVNYWWINSNRKVESNKYDSIKPFSIHALDLSNEELKKIKTGDKGVCYQMSPKNKIDTILEVTKVNPETKTIDCIASETVYYPVTKEMMLSDSILIYGNLLKSKKSINRISKQLFERIREIGGVHLLQDDIDLNKLPGDVHTNYWVAGFIWNNKVDMFEDFIKESFWQVEKNRLDSKTDTLYHYFDQIKEKDFILLKSNGDGKHVMVKAIGLVRAVSETIEGRLEMDWLPLKNIYSGYNYPGKKSTDWTAELFPLEKKKDILFFFPGDSLKRLNILIHESNSYFELKFHNRVPVKVWVDVKPGYSHENLSGPDQLDITNDINALASLISLKDLHPPLAVGLFGNWGSGKSFFMEKLKERINEYSNNSGGHFANRVVHIKFNAWHYSDSNLWASLVVHIFKELDTHFNGQKNDLKKLLNAELTSSQEIMQELELQKQDLRLKKKNNKVRLDQITRKKNEKGLFLRKLQNANILKELFQKDQELKGQVEKSLKKIGFDKFNIDDLKVDTLNNIRFNYKTLKSIHWLWYAVAIPLLLGGAFLSMNPFEWNYDEWISRITLGSSALVYGIPLSKLIGYFKKFRRTLNSVNNVADNLRITKTQQEQNINREISQLDSLIDKIELEQKHATEQYTQALANFNNFDINKHISNYIRSRLSSNDYQQHLGIISLIREDFEKLRNLLLSGDTWKEGLNDKEIELLEGKRNNDLLIDRIVLYIDDLDRCPKEIVIKVLEAIHLLLAFDLFVVVVGVDSRWVSSSLANHYPHLLSGNGIKNTDYVHELSKPKSSLDQASTYDYLEKIFQIPFALKPINEEGKKKYLKALLKKQMESKEEQPKESSQEVDTKLLKSQNGDKSLGGLDQTIALKAAPELGGLTEILEEVIDQPTEEAESPSPDTGIELRALTISEEEYDTICEIVPIIGETPRTLKRYINLYRLIKAHKGSLLNTAESVDEYRPIVFMLAIVVGNAPFAQEFFSKLRSNESSTLEEVIGGCGDSSYCRYTKRIKNFIKGKKEYQKIKTEDMLSSVDLMSRFSFRVIG